MLSYLLVGTEKNRSCLVTKHLLYFRAVQNLGLFPVLPLVTSSAGPEDFLIHTSPQKSGDNDEDKERKRYLMKTKRERGI